jgi:hypothetical protein
MKKIILLTASGLAFLATGCSKSNNAVSPQQQVEYYRIKEVSIDGQVTYSPVKMIIVNANN